MFAFLLIALAAGLSSVSAQQDQMKTNCSISDPYCEFSFFVFVEISPGADCYFNKSTKCSEDYPTWTIHGMWPTDEDGHNYPEYCNSSAEFDIDSIQDLKSQMLKYWPNMIGPHYYDPCCPQDKNTSYLWCHEWVKHGTCSQCIDGLGTEHGYFSKVLELYKTKMNYTDVLERYKIVPSTTCPYKMSEFVSAFEEALGQHPVLTCEQDKDRGIQVLNSIRTCLSKEYDPVRCPDSVFYEKNCNDNKMIYYWPYPS